MLSGGRGSPLPRLPGMSTTPAQRLRTALDLFELGEQMMRSRLRREHPEMDDAAVQAAVETWLRTRPGAEDGDFPGPASTRVISP